MNNEVYDTKTKKTIKMPKEMRDFFDEINKVCLKHNLSISHEDGHGSFEIEKYDENNIKWLESATKSY